MATSYKAQAIAHQLADWLKARLNGGLTVTEAFSTVDQNPYILVNDGSPVAGEANFVIKVLAQPWTTAQDVLGLTANVYSPTIVELCTEAGPSSTVDPSGVTAKYLMLVLNQISQMGTHIDWYETANATAPTIGALPSEGGSATLKTSWDPDLYRPLISQQ